MRRASTAEDHVKLDPQSLAKYANRAPASIFPEASPAIRSEVFGRILTHVAEHPITEGTRGIRLDYTAHAIWTRYRGDLLSDGQTFEAALSGRRSPGPMYRLRELLELAVACGSLRKTLEAQQAEIAKALFELEALEAGR